MTAVVGAEAPTRGSRALPHLPAVDGLRAVAVIAVILYHLPATWLPGGFLGVDVFFVISGFLITSLLTVELGRTGRISLRHFWARRARRLLPALVVMLAVVIAASALLARDALTLLASDVPPALGYFTNWWLIFHHVSYFESIGRPPLVLHLWSLAIEEQFYLVWPLALLVVARLRSRTAIGWLALAGAIGSSVWMAVLQHPYQDPSRAYFGTDSHAAGLMIGAALAIAFPPWARSSVVAPRARRLLDVGGLAAFGGLVALMATAGEYGTFTYRGGIQLASVLTSVLVLLASHPAVRVTRVLALPIMQWIGKRSYAMYLWHWPILELTRPGVDLRLPHWQILALRAGSILLASDLSYRLVEQPWRTGQAWATLRRWWGQRRPVALGAASGATAAVVGLALALAWAPAAEVPSSLAVTATPASRQPIEPLGHTGHGPGAPAGTDPGGPAGPGAGSAGPAPSPGPTTPPGTTPAPTAPPPTAPPPTTAATGPVLAIGDSVMLDAAGTLAAKLGPSTVVDAVVGRQVSTGIERLAAYRASGRLAGLSGLVIGLGTNGPMSPAQCQQILSLAAGVPRVVLVNVRMPRAWEPVTNGTLAGCVPGHPGVVLANWYQVSAAPGMLGPDQIHSSPAGAQAYAAMVASALGRD